MKLVGLRSGRRQPTLRRRLFLWFGASILLAMLSGVLAFWLTRDVKSHNFYQRSLNLVGLTHSMLSLRRCARLAAPDELNAMLGTPRWAKVE